MKDVQAGRLTVAVIDRRPMVRAALARRLAVAGWQVRQFETLAAALYSASNGEFAVDVMAVGICKHPELSAAVGPLVVLNEDRSIAELSDALRLAAADVNAHSAYPGQAGASRSLAARQPRQEQILRLIGQGQSAATIADRLGVSTSTVEHHKRQIFDRMGVQSQAHALAMALRESQPRQSVG